MSQKAEDENSSTPMAKELKKAIDFYRKKSSENLYQEKVKVKVTKGGKPLKNETVVAVSNLGVTHHQLTNKKGNAFFVWDDKNDYIQELTIGGVVLKGNKFPSGTKLVVDVDNLSNRKQM